MQIFKSGAFIALSIFLLLPARAKCESFFGIEIGKPFSVRECEPTDFEKSQKVGQSLCTRSSGSSVIQHPWGATTHQIQKPIGMEFAAWGFPPFGFFVKEFQGEVVEISVATFGMNVQSEALTDLITKLGKPNSLRKSIVENKFGAKFEKITANWNGNGFNVNLNGIDGSTDIGFITIEADSIIKERNAAKAWRTNNGTQLKM